VSLVSTIECVVQWRSLHSERHFCKCVYYRW